MKLSVIKRFWFLFSFLLSGCVAYISYSAPDKVSPLTDLLATILSILIGISLAISAILSSSHCLNDSDYKDDSEKKRVATILRSDDLSLIDGQTFIFWCYYLALILAISLKMASSGMAIISEEPIINIISSAFSFIACFSILWSATLPTLLRQINIQRKNLN
jgi:ABC-type Fe3+ transport system permease subunit